MPDLTLQRSGVAGTFDTMPPTFPQVPLNLNHTLVQHSALFAHSSTKRRRQHHGDK